MSVVSMEKWAENERYMQCSFSVKWTKLPSGGSKRTPELSLTQQSWLPFLCSIIRAEKQKGVLGPSYDGHYCSLFFLLNKTGLPMDAPSRAHYSSVNRALACGFLQISLNWTPKLPYRWLQADNFIICLYGCIWKSVSEKFENFGLRNIELYF